MWYRAWHSAAWFRCRGVWTFWNLKCEALSNIFFVAVVCRSRSCKRAWFDSCGLLQILIALVEKGERCQIWNFCSGERGILSSRQNDSNKFLCLSLAFGWVLGHFCIALSKGASARTRNAIIPANPTTSVRSIHDMCKYQEHCHFVATSKYKQQAWVQV